MLTEDDKRDEESTAAIEALEMALLLIVAHGLFSESRGGLDIVGGAAVAARLNTELERHRKAVHDAVDNDLLRMFERNAASESVLKGDDLKWAKTEAGRIAREAIEDVRTPVNQLMEGMRESARQGYYEAARYARRMSNVLGYEKALESAVTELARDGVTCYSYTRKDGVTVKVPADVGIRRELTRAGKDRLDAQQQDIAERTGANYCDVSICPDARESHAAWQGKRYQLKGSGRYPNFAQACHVGDLVDGYGGYNCHHTRKLVTNPDAGFAFQRQIDELARLEGLGYTNERIRELRSRQRQLQNNIRKDKRALRTLEEIGADASDVRRNLNHHRAQVRQLVGENPEVLRREPWWEKAY